MVIRVNWEKFEPGTSFFVPCVNTVECGRQINEIAQRYGWQIDPRPVVEDGAWGIRVWRVM